MSTASLVAAVKFLFTESCINESIKAKLMPQTIDYTSPRAVYGRAQATFLYLKSIQAIMRGDDLRSVTTSLGHMFTLPLPESVGPHKGYILAILKARPAQTAPRPTLH